MAAVVDHIVLASPDLEATCAWFEEKTGIAPSEGGPHVGMGTRNRLCSLGENVYLEIIGPDPDQPAPDSPRPFGIDDLAEHGVVGWCVRTTDLAGVVVAANSAGHTLVGPFPMSREAPDGVLSWELAVGDGVGVLPFVIDWGATPHPSVTAATGVRLSSLELYHPAPEEVRPVLAAMEVGRPVGKAVSERLLVALDTPNGRVVLPS